MFWALVHYKRSTDQASIIFFANCCEEVQQQPRRQKTKTEAATIALQISMLPQLQESIRQLRLER